MNVRLANVIAAFLLAISATPLSAHHSIGATYDATKAMTISGKVREVRWGNPHTLLSIDVIGANGIPVSWEIEMGGSAVFFNPGFRKEDLFSGSVALQVWPARDGSITAAARVLTLPDGRQFDVHDTFAESPGKK